MLDRDRVMTCLPARPRSSAAPAAASTQERRKPGEIRLAVEHEAVGVFVREHVLGELRAEVARRSVMAARRALSSRLEAGARADEDRVIAVEDAGLFGREAERVLLPVERLDPAEERLVHEDGVAVLGQERRHLALDRLDRLVGMRARQVEEDAADALEQRAAAFQRLDGVGEGRRPRRSPRWRRSRRAARPARGRRPA